MPFEFLLPDLGEGITEAEVRKWLVKAGDSVNEHQSVLEIETDKAVVEVPSPKKGRVLKINKEAGDVVKVGESLMTIAEETEEAARGRAPSVSVVGVLPEEEEVLAAPSVRAYAKELGVDLAKIKGLGPGGGISMEDVKEASKKGIAANDRYGPVEFVEIKGLRKTIAKNLLAAQRTTAFVTGMDEADVTDLWGLREREKKPLLQKGIHLTFLPFFIKAAQHALREHPMLNASMDEEKGAVIVKKYYNIGVAVDTPEGLMVPVIKDADRKTLLEIAAEIQGMSERARQRKIRLDEMKGSSFTITNFGHFGGTFATPIINYPDVAILGTGKIAEKPWVRDGRVAVRKILHLSLTFDHRATDGADAAQFLTKVIRYLEDPAMLFIESA
ncbi:MAG: dihydrolipoamide acetyltransferase family protein [Thermodesulfovibrionales bacterium]|nr:dihydrolipoamide acetyltransferase family protein [Thermodesulfovibrionales bacterium]